MLYKDIFIAKHILNQSKKVKILILEQVLLVFDLCRQLSVNCYINFFIATNSKVLKL